MRESFSIMRSEQDRSVDAISSPDLPYGAIPVYDSRVNNFLNDALRAELQAYRANFTPNINERGLQQIQLFGYKIEASDFGNETFNKQLSPVVDGTNWYRGYRIPLMRGGEAFLFTDWIDTKEMKRKGQEVPQVEDGRIGGTRASKMYARGEVDVTELLLVASLFNRGIQTARNVYVDGIA